MAFFAECAAEASQLTKLEPMAGAALAISLAYLNLERFRYRSKIRDHARKKLASMTKDEGAIPQKLLNNKWFKEVDRLAALKDNDHNLPIEHDGKYTKMPDGFWSCTYSIIFERHQDRWLSFFFVGFAILALVFGVAHSVNHLTAINCFFGDGAILASFYVLTLSLLLPVVLVFLGSRVVRWATHYATECVEELEKLLQDDVQKARLRDIEPAAEGVQPAAE